MTYIVKTLNMKSIIYLFLIFLQVCLCSKKITQFYNISLESWNKEYSKGEWEYLDKIAIERARAAVIATLHQTYSKKNGLLLDVGCGEGVLSDFLMPDERKRYIGVDISDIAIKNAKEKRHLNFIASTAERYLPSERYDTIVFNEMLYYVNHRHVLKKYSRFLNPDGIIIISIWYSKKVDVLMTKIFQDAGVLFAPVDEIYLSGVTVPGTKTQKMPVSFRIGVFKASFYPEIDKN